MILLDTNLISETMRPAPDEGVTAWLSEQSPDRLWLSAITVAEIRYGLAILPKGRRRSGLTARFERFLELGFDGRILPFDQASADAYGEIMAQRRKAGQPLHSTDGQIAAIALTHGMALATRNLRDFDSIALTLINPWQESSS